MFMVTRLQIAMEHTTYKRARIDVCPKPDHEIEHVGVPIGSSSRQSRSQRSLEAPIRLSATAHQQTHTNVN